ncbi:MAG: Ig-like domain-containing protein, partial [Gammaproteobacteria bacterium]
MLLVCGSALLLSLSGCGGGGSSSGGGGTKVSSIAITPTSASIAEGATQQFTAVAKDANGATISGVSFTWSSSDTGVATINASGLATGVATGTTSITASAQGVTSPAAALSVTTAPPSTPLQGQYAFLV